MKWFEGEIPAAIADSRQKQGVFVVVILHKPELKHPDSEKMEVFWNATNEDSCSHPIVAVRVLDGTETKDHFTSLYPVPVLPAAYLIDHSGKPLDVITLKNAPDEAAFNLRLNEAVNKLIVQGQGDQARQIEVAQAAPSLAVRRNAANRPEAPTNAVSPPPGSANVSAESRPSVSVDREVEIKEGSSSTSAPLTVEEKVRRAQELLAKKHAEDEKKRRDEEVRKETERRNLGKLMAEAKTNRDDAELRAAAEQRRREKLENERQLEKLREQIKADREERLNREQRGTPQMATQQAEECCVINRSKASSTDCRIQVKFPDKSALVASFQPNDTFSLLVDRILEDGRQGSDFVLAQNYPRREFAAEDFSCTFAELNLAPSATILVFQARNRSGRKRRASSSWSLSSLFELAWAPIQALLQYLMSFIWTTQNVPRVTGTEAEGGRSREANKRQDGNIHRFRNENDSGNDSDEEARWNGNSTQQL